MPEYRAALHSVTKKSYRIWSLAYGQNPFGPRGGTCGSVTNATWIAYGWCGTGPFGSYPPNWLDSLALELQERQLTPGTFKVSHVYGSRTYKIILNETV